MPILEIILSKKTVIFEVKLGDYKPARARCLNPIILTGGETRRGLDDPQADP